MWDVVGECCLESGEVLWGGGSGVGGRRRTANSQSESLREGESWRELRQNRSHHPCVSPRWTQWRHNGYRIIACSSSFRDGVP